MVIKQGNRRNEKGRKEKRGELSRRKRRKEKEREDARGDRIDPAIIDSELARLGGKSEAGSELPPVVKSTTNDSPMTHETRQSLQAEESDGDTSEEEKPPLVSSSEDDNPKSKHETDDDSDSSEDESNDS